MTPSRRVLETVWSALSAAVARATRGDQVVFDDGGVLAWDELQERSLRVARSLTAVGVGRGGVIAIYSTARSWWPEVYFGSAAVGARLVPLNTRQTPDELRSQIRASGATHVFTSFDDAQPRGTAKSSVWDLLIQENADDQSPLLTVISQGGSADSRAEVYDAFLIRGETVQKAAIDAAVDAVRADDVFLIQYTSGTSGAPKGALLTQSAMVRAATAHRDSLQISSNDSYFSPLPFHHVGGSILGMLLPIVSGCQLVVQRRFEPVAALETMDRLHCTATIGHQPHWCDYLRILEERDPPRQLTKAYSLAGPTVNYRIERRLGIQLITPYGLSETHTAGTSSSLDDDITTRIETVGRCHSGVEITIRDPETASLVTPGELGEVWFRGWCVMRGYHNDRERTRAAFDDEGWLRTGDLGQLDDAGRLRLCGRIKDVIRVGGENVSALEVEERIMAHPQVAQAAVIGVEDERLGEVCVAFVQAGTSTPSADELIDWCHQGLARYKVPHAVHHVREWPLTASGKISRVALREMLDARRSAA